MRLKKMMPFSFQLHSRKFGILKSTLKYQGVEPQLESCRMQKL